MTSETYPDPRTGKAVGMAFGLKHFLTLSDGSTIDSPEMLKRSINKIRKANKKLSACEEGSNHKRAAKKNLERAHEAVVNRRKDWLYKLADWLTKKYAIICIEELNIKAMQMLWGRKISDYAIAKFVSILEWVALKNGSTIIKIDRRLASNKACHVCGAINTDLPIKDRNWICSYCGTEHDRDTNAAINILNEGLAAPA